MLDEVREKKRWAEGVLELNGVLMLSGERGCRKVERRRGGDSVRSLQRDIPAILGIQGLDFVFLGLGSSK